MAFAALLEGVNIDASIDVNQAADQLGSAIQQFGSNAVVINMDKKGHSFYCYNDLDFVKMIAASKPHAGPGCIAICHKAGFGPTIKVYVDDENPEFIVTEGSAFAYTGQGMKSLGTSEDIMKQQAKRQEQKRLEAYRREDKRQEAKRQEEKKVQAKKHEEKKLEAKKQEAKKVEPKKQEAKKVEPKKKEAKKPEVKKQETKKSETRSKKR